LSTKTGIRIPIWSIIAVVMAFLLIWILFFGGYQLAQQKLQSTGITTPSPSPSPYSAPAPSGSIPLTLNLPFLIFNGTSVSAAATCPQAELFSGSVSPTTLVGTSASGTAITGNIVITNQYFLLVTPSTSGTYGTLENSVSSNANGITVGSPTTVLYQGQWWSQYPISFAGLGQIALGVTATINLYGYTAESATTVSLLNSTAIGTSSYGYATTTSYFNCSGITAFNYGQGYKIVRMEVNMSASNATIYDNSEFVLKSATINMGNGQSMTTNTINWMGVNNAYVEIGNANGALYLYGQSTMPQSSIGCLPVLLGQNDSPSGTMTINLQWYGKQVSSDVLVGTLKLVYISPTGTLATVYSPLLVS